MGQISTSIETVKKYTVHNFDARYWCWYCVPQGLKNRKEVVVSNDLFNYCIYEQIYRIDDCAQAEDDEVWACEKHALEMGWIW